MFHGKKDERERSDKLVNSINIKTGEQRCTDSSSKKCEGLVTTKFDDKHKLKIAKKSCQPQLTPETILTRN